MHQATDLFQGISIRRPLFIISLTVLPLAAQAEHKALPDVSVQGHYDNGIGTSDSASEGVVTGRLIENRPRLRPGEVLEFVPGLIVTQHSGDGKANQYFLRGFNLDHGTDFSTTVDGMPVNMRTHAHGQGYTDLNFLIPELVDSIRYRKGPYFAEEGDFSSAGAAHLGLYRSLPKGQASLTLGPDGYQRALALKSNPWLNGQLLYGLELQRNNGPWDVPEGLRKTNAILRYSSGSSDNGQTLTAMAYQNRWTSTDQVPLRAVNSGQIGRFGSLDPSSGGESSRYSLSWTLRDRQGNQLREANAYAIASALDLYSNFTYFLDNPVDGDQFNQREKRTLYGLNLSNTWAGHLAGMDTQTRLGIQTRMDRISPVGLYTTVQRQRLGTTREDRVNQESIGLYADNSLQWTPWLRTVAGVRVDSYRFRVNSDLAANSGKASDSITSPKLSVILGPWAKTEYFVNWGKGFHSNDARGTTQTQLPGGGGPTSPVTPLVGTKGREIGVRTEWIPGLQTSLALWELDIASELVFIGDAGNTEPSRASRRRGIELNNHYVIRPWLLMDLDLAASRARFRDNDPAGPFVPGAINKVASFGLTVTDQGPWYGGVQLRYFGPRALIEDNSARSASTVLAYGRLGYKLTPSTRLTADVFNLFNRKANDIDYFYTSRLNGEPAAGVDDFHIHPVEPRTLRVTLSQQF
ncbi:MAG: TonB-dependent receptor [Limnobacter sp.]|uniref:TonB-dependent receptor n=1 Tax=Limnobacter sp. TaxID=2003368 RepID=UPI00391C5994